MAGSERGTIVVTGGGRGIGAAVSLRAASEGYAVCVNYAADASAAKNVAAAIRGLGGRAMEYCADVADEEMVSAMFRAAHDELGPIRVLVNNAGIPGQRLRLDEMPLTEVKRILDTNLLGTLLCSREAIRYMGRASGGGGGVIISLSSQVVRTGGRRLAVYTASKAGIEGLSLALSREVAAEGIRVNVVSPGIIDTEQQVPDDDERLRAERATPIGRLGTADEVAHAVLWLASDAASYVTGSVLPVAGGR